MSKSIPRNRIARMYDQHELAFLAGRPHFVDTDPAVPMCSSDQPQPARKISSDYLWLGLMLAASLFMWGLIIWKVGQVITADPGFK